MRRSENRGAAGRRARGAGPSWKLALALAGIAAVAPAARLDGQTSLTIYNDGRVLVRRTLPVAVPKGAST
jgi:hypothetical protein